MFRPPSKIGGEGGRGGLLPWYILFANQHCLKWLLKDLPWRFYTAKNIGNIAYTFESNFLNTFTSYKGGSWTDTGFRKSVVWFSRDLTKNMYFSLIFYLKKLVFFCVFLKMDTFSRTQLHNSPLQSIYIYRYYPAYITLLYPYLHIYYTLLVQLQQYSRIIFNKQSYW